ncbi:MAG: Flp pilus assembly complex ATPase component TadA [Candidatus Thiodiazotropha lotti]|nr:Flp pilus assembly complex ATPase component TadA [Candidatus Thiodiazotropha lotti]
MNVSHQYISQMLGQFLGPVMTVLDDPQVEEVMINAPDQIWVERRGDVERLDASLTKEAVFGAISVLGRMEGKDVAENTENAILDTQLGDYRVAAALAPTASQGHSMCIRRHSHQEILLEQFAVAEREEIKEEDQVDPADAHNWLAWIVKSKKTVLISGGTSTGKTTFMRSLIQRGVDPSERLIFIEDVPELRIDAPNKVCFQVNEQAGIDTRALVRLALRYRPDRVIIGEVRGAEAFDLMQAINTGHEGSLASIHANSAFAALARLETLVLTAGTGWPLEAIRMQIASTIDYVIQMSRSGKRRVIAEIIELQGHDQSGYRFHKIV